MNKYNEAVESYVVGLVECTRVTDRMKEKYKAFYDAAERRITKAVNNMCNDLEETVKCWTPDDFDLFIKMAVNDKRVDNTGILLISTAYVNTHPGSEDIIRNDVCEKAYYKESLDTLMGLFDLIGGK